MDERAVRAVLDEVGPRLRRLRTARGQSLAEVSTATGTSVSTLSRLESGGRRATLELLLPLAALYGTTLDELVTTRPARTRRPTTNRHGVTSYPLTAQPGGLRAFKQVLAPGAGEGLGLQTHAGYEWVYVLSGRLRLRLGVDELVLPAGEVAEFDTRTPHAMSNPFARPAETLSIFGVQGERMHVRARPARRT